MSVQIQNSDRLEFIKYKGKQIFFSHYAGLGGDDMLNLLKLEKDFRISNADKLEYILIDTKDANITRPCLSQIKENMTIELPNLKKAAIIGITGVKKALLATANRFGAVNIKPFGSEDDAKEWLIS
ncbi:MAG: hypothetical protein GY870_00720 [archaeon]|nr:hypothetical protein [archaeon]